MTRTKKLELLKKYRSAIYAILQKHTPHLIEEPDNATDEEITFYNKLIAREAMRDHNNTTFQKNFSF